VNHDVLWWERNVNLIEKFRKKYENKGLGQLSDKYIVFDNIAIGITEDNLLLILKYDGHGHWNKVSESKPSWEIEYKFRRIAKHLSVIVSPKDSSSD
jgi:hypothetical protein